MTKQKLNRIGEYIAFMLTLQTAYNIAWSFGATPALALVIGVVLGLLAVFSMRL